jgi:2,3-bisphosphoglycerate-dependent phosphoglycerate mutase
MSETHLYLIRHAQAVVNTTRAIGGPKGDVGLTELGISQAERLRDRLAKGEIAADVLIASTLPRAKQTAEIIAPSLGLPIEFDDELHELRVGEAADGLAHEDYVARFGWTDIRTHPFLPVDPGGESLALFHLRVCTVLDKICKTHAGKTVVCVTHGGVIDSSFVYCFGLGAHQMPHVRFHTHNTSLTHWVHHLPNEPTEMGTSAYWRLLYYNDWHHLKG